jgi:hypothetical protein
MSAIQQDTDGTSGMPGGMDHLTGNSIFDQGNLIISSNNVNPEGGDVDI